MEPYQYWTLLGFLFLVADFFSPKVLFLPLAGSMFFGAVFAFKFPDFYFVQILASISSYPLCNFALGLKKS